MLFNFDSDKNLINLEKHGISLADAWLVFFADHKLTLDSNRNGEKRWLDLAWVEMAGTVLVLVYTIPQAGEVRAISLRRASRQERKRYEQEQLSIQDKTFQFH